MRSFVLVKSSEQLAVCRRFIGSAAAGGPDRVRTRFNQICGLLGRAWALSLYKGYRQSAAASSRIVGDNEHRTLNPLVGVPMGSCGKN